MEIKPDIKIKPSSSGDRIKEFYVGFKVHMTFEEVGKVFRKIKSIFKK